MMTMARTKAPTMNDFHTSWASACAPHVSEAIEAVALFNPPGAVAGQAAAIAGRSGGGLLGRFAGAKAAAAGTTTSNSTPVPPVVIGVVTATTVQFFEAEVSSDAAQVRIVAPWQAGGRDGLMIEVNRKIMSERITFHFAGHSCFDLDGMFTPKSKERPYQGFIDALR